MRPAHWLPPVVWMALILLLSSDAGSAAHTRSVLLPILGALLPWATPFQLDTIHGLLRKGAHVTEYAVLAALWLRALIRGRGLGARTATWSAFTIAVCWALVDELLQSWQLSRTGSPMDVAIDAAGAMGALAAARRGWRASADGATAILLWIAAAGGAVLLAANALAGVSSGALWLTTPAAALGLLARHRGIWR